MCVMNEVLQILGLARPALVNSPAAVDNQELANTLRRLPGRYHDRLPGSTLQRVTGSAASGQWEKAVDQLVMALYTRDAPVTADERDELRDVLQALDMPTHRVDTLPEW